MTLHGRIVNNHPFSISLCRHCPACELKYGNGDKPSEGSFMGEAGFKAAQNFFDKI